MVSRLKYLIVFLSLCSAPSIAFSQDVGSDTILDQVLLRKKLAGGIVLHSRGWGFQFQKGRNITYFKSIMWEVNAVSMKSPKQVRTINPYFSNAKSYFYGKMNHVFVLRGGIGFDRMLNRKPYWGGVELRLVAFGGVSLAIAKPIYLYILKFTSSYYDYQIVIEKYDPSKHFLDNIYGRAPFSRGLGEMKFYPGVYGKVGMNFEYGQYNSKIKSIELGAVIEFFPIPVPIMALSDGNYYFLTLYINVSIGKRFN
jgi:hypothetical protein